MTIEQTIDVPVNHRVYIEVPQEIPAGRTMLAFTPAQAVSATVKQVDTIREHTQQATPHTDWLCGLLSDAGDISLDELRAERLSKYLK